MKKLVFLSYSPLTDTLRRLFPIDLARAEGLPTEYWDLSALFGHEPRPEDLDQPYIRRFSAWPPLEAALLAPDARETFVMTAVPDEPRFFRLGRLLSRSPASLGRVISGVLPMPSPGGLDFVRRNLRRLADPAKVAHFALKRAQAALGKAGLLRGYDYVFAAGAAAREQAGRARVVPINQYDYDDWLRERERDPRPIPERYAVYLDQFAPAHPDFKFLGITKLIEPVRYYGLLDAYFSRLEAELDLEVVIAAHPKSDYPENPFGGRKILRGATRPLVRHCELALATHSTSISFAVLGRKPLTFFTTDDICESYRAIRLDELPFHFASVLGRPCHTLDRLPAGRLETTPVDEPLYADYERRYLVSPESAGRTSEEVYREFFAAR